MISSRHGAPTCKAMQGLSALVARNGGLGLVSWNLGVSICSTASHPHDLAKRVVQNGKPKHKNSNRNGDADLNCLDQRPNA